MTKRSPEELTKVTLNLYTSDYDRLKEIFEDVGPTVAVREIVRAHLQLRDAKMAQTVGELVDEIDLEDVDEA